MKVEAVAGRALDLVGKTVVVIGGSAGIGLETARLARVHGADVILTARDAERLERAANEIGAARRVAFDATDAVSIELFFRALPMIDHVLVTAGRPYYGPLAELDLADARRAIDAHLVMALEVARAAADKIRPGGTLLFMSGTGARHAAVGLGVTASLTAAISALAANLALELAPVRVNVIAAGFVDTPLSAALLGSDLDARRKQLRETLPIRRVVQPADVAALAVHLMTNTALTGATYDIDGGQQLI